jgi:hypothetical protein
LAAVPLAEKFHGKLALVSEVLPSSQVNTYVSAGGVYPVWVNSA